MSKVGSILIFAATLLLFACSPVDYSAHRLPAGLVGERPVINQSYLYEVSENRRALTLDYLERHNTGLYEAQKDKIGIKAITFEPEIIVIHYTVIKDLQETITYFSNETIEQAREKVAANGALNVGVQFVVDRDGKIYQLYPETVIARHTIGLNHTAIGIENIGNGDLNEAGKSHPLTEAQLASNILLVKYFAGKYPQIQTMIGHSEYRMLEDKAHPAHGLFHEKYPEYRTEKIDPGDIFMKRLREGLN